MADSIYKWSLTAASNDAIDSAINWRENQLPDTVNDSNRAMMMRVAEWREDMTGGLVTAGTQPAYTVTTKAAFDTLADGRWFTARVHATNATGAATLNVNGLGAKSIRKFGTSGDMPLGVGDLQLGGLYQFMYSASGNAGAGAWVVPNPSIATGGGFASGTAMLFMQAAAPVGWTKDATHNNKALRIVSGTGGVAGGTTAFTTVFASRTPAGNNTAIALTLAQMPSHTHTNSVGNQSVSHNHSWSDSVLTTSDGVHTHTAPAVTEAVGSSSGLVRETSHAGLGTISPLNNSLTHQHTVSVGGTTGVQSASHDHTVTINAAGSGATHDHTFTGTAMDFAVQYVDALICMKD